MNCETQNTTSAKRVMNNRQALDAARAMGIDSLDAQLLLLFALGRSLQERAWLLAHDTDTMLQDEQDQFIALLQRRAIGVPVAYLTGEKEFYSLPFSVDKRVLVPRPETELLVDWVKELLPLSKNHLCKDNDAPLKILDLGTGSGVLAITIKYHYPAGEVTAVDVSEDALGVAKLNAAELLPATSTVRFLQGSWFEPLDDEYFDFIISNPPYVAQGDIHLDALTHEPQGALVSGLDGLDDIKHIIKQAKTHLHSMGQLLLEHGYDQAQTVQQLMEAEGFKHIETRQDLAGIDRATRGQMVE